MYCLRVWEVIVNVECSWEIYERILS